MNTFDNSHISTAERLISLSLLVFLTIIFGLSGYFLWITGAADNVFIVQLSDSIAQRGLPLSQVSQAIQVMFAEILGKKWEYVCNLNTYFDYTQEFNYFKWHTYVFLYVVAPFNYFFGARTFLPFLTAFSFCFLVFYSYRVLRQRGINVLLALGFVILVALHPAWHQSISGQLYCDRFYYLCALPFLFALIQDKPNYLFIVILGTLITSISDRFGGVVGMQLMYVGLLPILSRHKINVKYLVLGLIFALVSFVIIRFYSEYEANKAFSSTLTLTRFLSSIKEAAFFENLVSFLGVNFIGLGLLALCAPLWLPLLLVTMYPNIVGTIGGAEKIGFLSHYHTTYFPVLVFCSIIGLYNLQRHILPKLRVPKSSLLFVISVIIVANIMVTTTRLPAYESISENMYLHSFSGIKLYQNGSIDYYEDVSAQINKRLAAGDTLVTTEFGLTKVALSHAISIVPLGLENADYALLPILDEANRERPFRIGGSISYNGTEDMNKQNECFNDLLLKHHFDLDNANRIGSWVLIKRKKENT